MRLRGPPIWTADEFQRSARRLRSRLMSLRVIVQRGESFLVYDRDPLCYPYARQAVGCARTRGVAGRRMRMMNRLVAPLALLLGLLATLLPAPAAAGPGTGSPFNPNPCENGGTCMEVVGGAECICPPGFIGPAC